MLYECQHDGVRAKGRSRRYAQFAQNITNDHSHYWDTCGGPVIKRLCFSVVLRNSTQWSLGPQHYDNCDPMGKRTPTSVRRRSSRVDFRLRNPSSPDVVFVMKALFSILDPQNRVETNTCFVFAHDFVLASRYLHFFPLLTYITDSKKFLRCLLFTDGRLQLQHSNTSTKSVKTEKKLISELPVNCLLR